MPLSDSIVDNLSNGSHDIVGTYIGRLGLLYENHTEYKATEAILQVQPEGAGTTLTGNISYSTTQGDMVWELPAMYGKINQSGVFMPINDFYHSYFPPVYARECGPFATVTSIEFFADSLRIDEETNLGPCGIGYLTGTLAREK